MNLKPTSALLLAALCSSAFAQTLVSVNGQNIDSREINAQAALIAAQNKNIQNTPELRRALTENAVVAAAVSQEAKRLKLDRDPAYQKALKDAREAAKKAGADKKAGFQTEWNAFESNLLGQTYALHAAKQNPVQEKDVKAAYDAFSTFYKGTQEVQLGSITIRNGSDAEKAAAELNRGKSFQSILKTYSADERAKQSGGLTAYIPLKDLQQSMPAVYAAVKDLKQGQASAPLKNNGVFGVFYVNSRRNISIPAYSQIKDTIADDLQAERIDRAVDALLQKADIKAAK